MLPSDQGIKLNPLQHVPGGQGRVRPWATSGAYMYSFGQRRLHGVGTPRGESPTLAKRVVKGLQNMQPLLLREARLHRLLSKIRFGVTVVLPLRRDSRETVVT